MEELTVQEAVAQYAEEVAEQQNLADSLINAIASMGVDTSELSTPLILDSLAVEGIRLAPMDEHKNIASLAYFDMVVTQ